MSYTWPLSGEIYASGSPEERIAMATYGDLERCAIDLYRKLAGAVEDSAEQLDFGETAIDIGSRDGRYIPVIKEFGFSAITAVDPSAEAIAKGRVNGLFKNVNVVQGTLEDLVATSNQDLDSAFLFNLAPDLPRKPEFISALLESVKPGGLVISSFVELETARTFATTAYGRGLLEPVKKKPRYQDESYVIYRQNPENQHTSTINGWLGIGRKSSMSSF